MTGCNSFLIRTSCAGTNLDGYDPQWRGQLAKSLHVISRVALLIIAALALTHLCVLAPAIWSLLALSITSFVFFIGGSSSKRNNESLMFEFLMQLVCLALALFSLAGLLTQLQLGIAMISTLGGGMLIGACFQKDSIRKLELSIENNDHLLIPENSFSQDMPLFPIRLLDQFMGCIKDLASIIKSSFTKPSHKNNYSAIIREDTRAEALCVLIHGLRGQPATYDFYHDMFKKKLGNRITIFQPHVTNKGNCSLDEAADPIYTQIALWSKEHPNRPIVLIGGSNGARLAGYIAAKLKTKQEKEIENPIQACCIAGPFYGTKMINQPDFPKWMGWMWEKVVKIIYCDTVYEELSWASDRSQSVIKEMQTGGEAGVHYKFYSSLADLQIQSLISGNPSIINAEYYFSGIEGHSSLVRTAQDHIGQVCFQFIEDNR